jgi:hypothetical protein
MKAEEANTIRRRIELYDKYAGEIHHLQRVIDTVMLHRDRPLKLEHVGLCAGGVDVPPEIATPLRTWLMGAIREQQQERIRKQCELDSPSGTAFAPDLSGSDVPTLS